MRQWVLSVPKRLRYFMQREGAVLNMVLRIFLRVIAQSLQACAGTELAASGRSHGDGDTGATGHSAARADYYGSVHIWCGAAGQRTTNPGRAGAI